MIDCDQMGAWKGRAQAAAAAGIALFAVGCDKHDRPAEATAASATATAAVRAPQSITTGVADREITIGQPAAFTGPAAGLGIKMWRGASAAFSEMNDKGASPAGR